jgi:hypothetical protein
MFNIHGSLFTTDRKKAVSLHALFGLLDLKLLSHPGGDLLHGIPIASGAGADVAVDNGVGQFRGADAVA